MADPSPTRLNALVSEKRLLDQRAQRRVVEVAPPARVPRLRAACPRRGRRSLVERWCSRLGGPGRRLGRRGLDLGLAGHGFAAFLESCGNRDGGWNVCRLSVVASGERHGGGNEHCSAHQATSGLASARIIVSTCRGINRSRFTGMGNLFEMFSLPMVTSTMPSMLVQSCNA